MNISYKNPLNSSLIEIKESFKNKDTGEWECPFLYNSSELVVTTPKIKIEDNTILFDSNKREAFVDFIEKLESSVVEHLSENSSKIFKGKKFTKERIKSSLVPSIYIDDEGVSYIQTSFNENLECFDFFLDRITKEELGEDVIAGVHVKSIVFNKELFRIDYQLTRLKNYKVVSQKKIDFNTDQKQQEEIEEGNFFE